MLGKKKRRIWLPLAVLLAGTVVAALDARLAVRHYRLETVRVSAPVRIALLTDLHSCDYGEGQAGLLKAVAAEGPDVVLLGGDIVDDDARMDPERAYTAASALAASWPTYYVSGNHEFWSGEADAIKTALEARGVTVLEGACVPVAVDGQTIQLCGVDDPAAGEAVWRAQLERAAAQADPDLFTILLTHRPERVEAYRGRGFDLILAGHAHGGQWRLPGVVNGLLAPDQGLFPPYAGGRYELEGGTLIVSRGLARESTRVPRVFNRPELVIIDVTPAC